jgi:hypothetical protein
MRAMYARHVPEMGTRRDRPGRKQRKMNADRWETTTAREAIAALELVADCRVNAGDLKPGDRIVWRAFQPTGYVTDTVESVVYDKPTEVHPVSAYLTVSFTGPVAAVKCAERYRGFLRVGGDDTGSDETPPAYDWRYGEIRSRP